MPYSFQPLAAPLQATTFNLHRLRTAFSPASSRPSSTATTSPLSLPRTSFECSPAPSDFSLFSGASDASTSSRFFAARLRHTIMLRHRPSAVELGLEQEKREFAKGVEMFEPRPAALGCAFGDVLHDEPVVASIFEVLGGSA